MTTSLSHLFTETESAFLMKMVWEKKALLSRHIESLEAQFYDHIVGIDTTQTKDIQPNIAALKKIKDLHASLHESKTELNLLESITKSLVKIRNAWHYD